MLWRMGLSDSVGDLNSSDRDHELLCLDLARVLELCMEAHSWFLKRRVYSASTENLYACENACLSVL